jgi:hypothetical protein
MSTFRRSLGVSLIVMLLAGMAIAQSGTSSVRGTVVDPQSSVIPNATVTITNTETGAVRTQKSGPSGNFSFDLITPGTYRVEASAPNFKKAVFERVEALIDKPTDLSVQLQIGAANESITVESESSSVQVNTQDSSLGNNFVSSQITQLPVEARNVLSLLTLQPGVTGSPNASGYVSGARSDQSNVTLDGVNINDAQTNSISSPVLRLNGEAIDEFRVNTFTSNAAAARSSGAQIALVTKSGTNSFHGAAFEFNRNTIFTANDWFNNHNGVKRPALIRNTFGGAVGGPIIKNKLFFFASYERRRDASQTPVSAVTVPLATLGQGIIRFNNSNGQQVQLTATDVAKIFPDAGVNQAAISAIAGAAKSYVANSTSVGDGLNTSGFIHNAPLPVFQNSTVVKFDYNLAHNHILSLRGNYIDDHVVNGGSERFPGGRTPTSWNHPTGIAAKHTWTIGSNWVSNFTYGVTRQAFTNGGDTASDVGYLRLIFQPVNFSYDNSRVTPVHNFTEDLSWVKGNHTIQFGGVVTLVNNGVINFNKAFSSATTNPSGYKTNLITNSVNQYLKENFGYTEASSWRSSVENAVTALLGRYNNYSANFLYNLDGTLQAAGTPSVRHFATQGYEGYIQDNWKIRPNLTLTGGLRYNLWRPVYETQGFEVQPTTTMDEIFKRRVAAMNSGTNDVTPIVINKSGPVNGGKPMYDWDKNNFLPRVGIAWSPKGDNFITRLMGGEKSVLRGGLSMLPDYFGESVATFFERYNTLGFASATTIPVNTFNVGCGHYVVVGNALTSCTPALGPLFTSFTQNVRTLPGVPLPKNLTFPLQQTEQAFPTRIESSLDSKLTTPKNYAVSLTYEREMPKSGKFQVSYVGRFARNLLAQRDMATPINLKDPTSGQTLYQAGTILEKARQAGVPLSQVGVSGGTIGTLPFFEHFFGPRLADVKASICPSCTSATQAWYADALGNTNDWTTTELDFEDLSILGKHAFYQPQYGSLFSWDTIAKSNYHSLQATYQERLKDLTLDFNYTYSHSLDDASGLQSGGQGTGLIWNPFQPQDSYTHSDFDLRHQISVAAVWQLPFGRGKAFGGGANGLLNAIIGGWQFSSITRFNTGEPYGTPYDSAQWATNWEYQSYTTADRSTVPVNGCSTRLVKTPAFFGNCLQQAYSGFRSAYPGDTGDRNYLRLPSYATMDTGLRKKWNMPYNEHHQLEFGWEAFNITNYQPFYGIGTARTAWGMPGNPIAQRGAPPSDFSNWTSIQGKPRAMQFGLRYSF